MELAARIYRVARWFMLGAAIITIGLMISRPQPLVVRAAPPARVAANAESFQSKLGELRQAHQSGQSGAEARISSEEVAAALAVANPEPATTSALNANAPVSADQVPLKDQQVIFERDEVKAQFTTQVAGKDVVVTLTGHVGSKDGYVDFLPTSFHIGTMPVPISLVQEQLQRKLLDPAVRENLRLPEFVSDVRIENGQLVITEK
ncbi:MAG TPA: hypothetical protein VG498_16735 [Terriglobales bacterium]|nr:hypothetical protein [Terriglobales bacterium]